MTELQPLVRDEAFDFLREATQMVKYACIEAEEPQEQVTSVWYDDYTNTWWVAFGRCGRAKRWGLAREVLLERMQLERPTYYRMAGRYEAR